MVPTGIIKSYLKEYPYVIWPIKPAITDHEIGLIGSRITLTTNKARLIGIYIGEIGIEVHVSEPRVKRRIIPYADPEFATKLHQTINGL